MKVGGIWSQGGVEFWHFGSSSTTSWPVLNLHNTAGEQWESRVKGGGEFCGFGLA